MAKADAIVIGSGPNGLAAAIRVARSGHRVVVYEAQPAIGGGARSAELTLSGYVHDVCSAIHPLARLSPFFLELPLERHGLEWVTPPAALAHPFDDGTAAILEPSFHATGATLGADAGAWQRLMGPFAANWRDLGPDILGPLGMPSHPLLLARFGLRAFWSASALVAALFTGARARALFAGIAAHSCLPLDRTPSAAFGMVLGIAAHVVSWPFPKGGAQKITDALVSYLRAFHGEIRTASPVASLEALPPAAMLFCDVTPRQLLAIGGLSLPRWYRKSLAKYRYGPGAFKVDWALDGPIPWKARECARAATVHVGGGWEEIAEAEDAPWKGRVAERPFVVLAQHTLFDPTRAPAGKHTAWAYCHVPNGCTVDMTEAIERQIERFAPGFRDRVLARSVRPPRALEAGNANLVGGDINGGAATAGQLFLRPTRRMYDVPRPGVYLCSSSTPPGGGVHGMCGFFAAEAALKALKSKKD